MRAREPILKRGRDVWDEVNMPRSELEGRVDTVRARMREDGLDGLVVYGRGDDDGHVGYLTNLVSKVPHYGRTVVLTDDSIALFNERSSRTESVIRRTTWVEDVRFSDDVVADSLAELGDAGIDAVGTVGFEYMPYDQWDSNQGAIEDASVTRFDETFSELRSLKSPRERDQVRRAARIVSELLGAVEDHFDGPTTERAIEREVDRLARHRGVRDVRFLVSNTGVDAGHFRPAEPIGVPPDRPFAVYSAVNYEGYWAAAIRTLRIDGATPAPEVFGEAEDAYERFLGELHAGSSTKAVASVVGEALAGTGVSLASEYGLGRGVGLDVAEAPSLGGGTDVPLRADVTVAPQLVLDADGAGLLGFGDTVLLGSDGPEVLTR